MPTPRRRFLRTTATTTTLVAGVAGCAGRVDRLARTARNRRSDARVHFRTDTGTSSPVGLAKASVWIAVAASDGRLVAMDPDGELNWREATGVGLGVGLVGHGDDLYVAGDAVVAVDSGAEL